MAEAETIHSTSGRVLTVASGVTALIAVTGIGLDSGWHGLLRFGALPVLFVAVVWAMFDRPYVRVSDGGVEIGNIMRTIQIPWPAVTDMELRWGLRLITRLGNYSAWSVPPPPRPKYGLGRAASRADPPREPGVRDAAPAAARPGERLPSRGAQAVVDRWHALQQAGFLDDPQLEFDKPIRHWNRMQLVVLTVLVLLSAAGIVDYRLG